MRTRDCRRGECISLFSPAPAMGIARLRSREICRCREDRALERAMGVWRLEGGGGRRMFRIDCCVRRVVLVLW